MSGVQNAIVHLAIPKKDVFTTSTDKPTASVLLALAPGTSLTRTQVRSVMHLVAGSVPSLAASDVTVTDANGTLLSTREDGAAGAASSASETDEETAQFEDRMSTAVQQMLDRVLGPGHAVVRVNAELDYASTETTSQTYVSASGDPLLTEATTSEAFNGAGGGAGGVLGQTWPTLTAASGSGNGGTYSKSERTVDNPVGSVVTKAQGAPGAVKRLSVAVVLDAAKTGVATNEVQQLVENAVGVDTEARRHRPGEQAALRHDGRPGGRQAARRRAGRRAHRGLSRARQEGRDRAARAARADARLAPQPAPRPGSTRPPATCPPPATCC